MSVAVSTITAAVPVDIGEVHRFGERIVVRTNEWDAELVKRIPGRVYNPREYFWHVPLAWSACLALRAEFGQRLEIGPDLWAWAQRELDERISVCTRLRTLVGLDDVDLPIARHVLGWREQSSRRLRPFQEVAVAMGVLARRMLLGDDLGLGKLQPISEPVLTPGGWTHMGDIRVGDMVIGQDGKPTEVLAVYPQGEKKIVRVTLNDGSWTRCGLEHLWSVQHIQNGKRHSSEWFTMTTSQLIEQGVLYSSGHRKWRVPMAEPVHYDSVSLPLDPYLLGVILGDGTVKNNGYTQITTDDEIIDNLGVSGVRSPHKSNGISVFSTGDKELKTNLVSLGLAGKRSWEKMVPSLYLLAAPEDRLALLQGLMDTDGCPHSDGGAEFSSTSPALVDSVVELVQSLGGIARGRRQAASTYTYNGENRQGRFAERINVRLPSPYNMFRLTRKYDRYVAPTKYPPTRTIASIEPDGVELSACIKISNTDGLYVTRNFIVTHNTVELICILRALHELGEDPFPALIVVPRSTKTSWRRRFEEWFPVARVEVLGSEAITTRRKVIAKIRDGQADVLVMSWQQLASHSRLAPYGTVHMRRCPECADAEHPADIDPRTNEPIKAARCHMHPKELQKIGWTTVIADEAHAMADPHSQQRRALQATADGLSSKVARLGGATFRFASTGTPADKKLDQLFPVMHLVHPGEYPVMSPWLARYAQTGYDPYGHWQVTGLNPATSEEFFATFDPRFLRRRREAVEPDLPEWVVTEREAVQSAKERKAYLEMRDALCAQVDQGFVVARNPLSASGRLIQLAASFGEVVTSRVVDKATGEITETQTVNPIEPSCKLDVLEEILAETEDPMVVCAVSRGLLELAAARFDKVNKEAARKRLPTPVPYGVIVGGQTDDERDAHLDAFQAGGLRVMLVTYGAGGEGITLTAARTLVRLQRHWSTIKNDQMLGRLPRIGTQHTSLSLIDVITKDTTEESQRWALGLKRTSAQKFIRDREMLIALLRNDLPALQTALAKFEAHLTT